LDKLYVTGLTPTQEEHILNLQLKHFLSSSETQNGLSYYERAKECLEKIRSKGYAIDRTLIDENVEEAINNLESDSITTEQFKEIKEDAIRTLLDFSTLWQHDGENGSVFSAYLAMEPGHDQYVPDIEEVSELHTAFYKRMCFEYESGSIAFFVESEILMDDFIVDILKNEFGYEENYYTNLKKWIDIIRNIISKDNKHAIQLLSVMMIEGVNWLTSHNRIKEAEKMLEDYIYNIDTQAFFTAYFDGRITTAVEPDIIYRGAPMVYCTENAKYLLDYYMKNGSNHKFDILMNQIENDIPIIDKYHIPSRETHALCEIVKYKFMKYRQSVGYTSKFFVTT